jgi:hypothetical protein
VAISASPAIATSRNTSFGGKLKLLFQFPGFGIHLSQGISGGPTARWHSGKHIYRRSGSVERDEQYLHRLGE